MNTVKRWQNGCGYDVQIGRKKYEVFTGLGNERRVWNVFFDCEKGADECYTVDAVGRINQSDGYHTTDQIITAVVNAIKKREELKESGKRQCCNGCGKVFSRRTSITSHELFCDAEAK